MSSASRFGARERGVGGRAAGMAALPPSVRTQCSAFGTSGAEETNASVPRRSRARTLLESAACEAVEWRS
eukprot:5316738-Alexandrium_andersonii.AAC.1